MAYTSLRSDYETFLRERNKNLAGVSEWERLFLQPLTQQTEAKVTAAQESAQYDISQAYANYKRNQMRLLQQNIDTGAQQQLSSGLQSAYNTAYSQRQQQLSSELGNIEQEYQTALASNQQQIQNVAGRLKEFTNLTLEKAGLSAMSQAELAKLGYLQDVGDGYEITNKLRNLYQQQLYGSDTDQQTLEDYIRQTSTLEGEKLETLIDDLYKYQNILNETMGLAPEQRVVDKNLQLAQNIDVENTPVIGDKDSFNAQSFRLLGNSTAPLESLYDKQDTEKLVTDVLEYVQKLGLVETDLDFDIEQKLVEIVQKAAKNEPTRSRRWSAFKNSYYALLEQIKDVAKNKYAQYR